MVKPGWVEAFIVHTEPLVLDPDNGVGELLAAERARIRRELVEWADANRFILYSDSNGQWLGLDAFRAALDRICPEGKE